MKVEWASSFRPDGTRCRPPPSTMHGWLAKMRGTLLGNEELRSEGMKEMKEARKRRAGRNGRPRRASTGRSIFSIFSFYMGPSGKPARQPTDPRGASLRPTYRTHQSHQSHQSHRSHTQGVRPSLKSNSRRSSGKTYHEPSSRSYNKPRNNRRSTR